MTVALTYEDLENELQGFWGSDKIYYRQENQPLRYTTGIKHFAEVAQAQWIIDNVLSYMPYVLKDFNETENNFFVVVIELNKHHEGFMEVYTEGYYNGDYSEHHTIIRQDIPFIDLPVNKDKDTTTYKFFLELGEVEPTRFYLLLPTEH